MKKNLFKVTFWFILLVVFLVVGRVEAKAAPFTRATKIRYDRMMTGKASSLQIIIVPTTAGTENKIKLIFASATVGAGQSVTLTNLPAGTTELPGTLTAVGSGTSIVVSGVADLTVGTTYAFNIATAGTGLGVTTPAAAAYSDTVQSLTSGDAVIDSTTVTSRIIANDQVTINANVPPTFTFVLSGNTDAFTSDLGASAVSLTGGISVAVSTNASKGWTGWVKSANTALSSVATGETIPTSGTIDGVTSTCSGGSDCYVLSVGVTSGTGAGSLTADAEYAGDGTSTGGTLSSIFQPFAARTGKTNGDTVWLKGLASILATKAAGSDYTDTWTVVGAGNF